MPTTIPYDPSLVLGSLISPEALSNILEISKVQADVDAKEATLNSFISMKHKLGMTITELANLNVPTTSTAATMKQLNEDLANAAGAYCEAKLEAEAKIQPLRAKIPTVHANVESPIDYLATQIKMMPLAVDSMSMDVQFFASKKKTQTSASSAESALKFISAATNWMGEKYSSQISTAAQRQLNQQSENESYAGTLVMSVSCSHKNAAVLAPFVLNVDKAIKVWNSCMRKSEQLNPGSRASMLAAAQAIAAGDAADKKLSIISGATFGSSFVGMVHVMNDKSNATSESLSASSASLQAQMDTAAWFASSSGGFGVNSSLANNVKDLLSTQNVSSHATLVCMGLIPTIASNAVKIGVKEFAKFDPEASMKAIATIQNATNADQNSAKQSADAARTGSQMLAIRSNDITSALSALQVMDETENKIIDINSMMTALDDYIRKVSTGGTEFTGVPINYYLKDITKDMLAEMWVAKYFPGEYMAIKYDDSPGGGGKGGKAIEPAKGDNAPAPANGGNKPKPSNDTTKDQDGTTE